MLLELAQWLAQDVRAFNVFSYITLRAVLATLTALVISFIVGPAMIRRLTAYKIGQSVRDDGPQTHLVKAGTPTMGGALILVSIVDHHAAVGRPRQPLRLGRAAGDAGLRRRRLGRRLAQGRAPQSEGPVGAREVLLAVGDRRSSPRSTSRSRSPRRTTRSSCGCSRVGAERLQRRAAAETELIVPFFKTISYPLGVLGFIVLTYFVIVGTSNAVNLTDGLDGLAIMPTVMVGGALGIFAYVAGNAVFSSYLGFPYIPGAGELAVFCGAIAGAGLGFLWFNAYPAEVFMGDVGALALGAALGTIAVIVRQEIVLFIMGGVFVVETLSVMIQVARSSSPASACSAWRRCTTTTS